MFKNASEGHRVVQSVLSHCGSGHRVAVYSVTLSLFGISVRCQDQRQLFWCFWQGWGAFCIQWIFQFKAPLYLDYKSLPHGFIQSSAFGPWSESRPCAMQSYSVKLQKLLWMQFQTIVKWHWQGSRTGHSSQRYLCQYDCDIAEMWPWVANQYSCSGWKKNVKFVRIPGQQCTLYKLQVSVKWGQETSMQVWREVIV